MRYTHGVFGALMDAFNPWDIIKMTARGFRWLFVGARKREQDISYQNVNGGKTAGLDGTTGYVGPTYAGTGGAATELDGRGRRSDIAHNEDDRAGLLYNQGNIGQRLTPYSTYSSHDYAPVGDGSQVDIASAGRSEREAGPNPLDFDMKPHEFDDDTSYHPRMGPAAGAARADAGGAVHPALRHGQGSAGWHLSEDADRIRRSR